MKRTSGHLRVFALLLLLVSTLAAAQGFLDFRSLFANNEVTLYGRVDDESAQQVIQGIQTANDQLLFSNPIYLYIDSPGGYVSSGGKIIDAMKASRRPVYTVVVSEAASMGAIIFEYGAKKLMLPHSYLMFHEASGGVYPGDSFSHLKSQVEFNAKVFDGYERHIAELAQISLEKFQLHEAHQWWLGADDALAAHLTDDVVSIGKYPAKSKYESKSDK